MVVRKPSGQLGPVEAHERLILDAARAFTERNIDGVLALMHPEAEVELIGGFEEVMGPIFQGLEGVRRFCREWFAAFKTMRVDVEKIIEAGEDRSLVLTQLKATGTGSDAPVELLGAGIYSFRDGSISRIAFYYDRDQASRHAGITSEPAGEDPMTQGGERRE